MKLLLLLLSFNSIAFSQSNNTTKILIKSCKTELPIPYASICIKDSHFGIYANDEGEITIDSSFIKQLRDTFILACVGFEKKSYPINEINTYNFCLNQSELILQDFVVHAGKRKKLKTMDIGFHQKKPNDVYTFGKKNSGHTIVTYIQNTYSESSIIKTLEYVFASKYQKNNSIIRVRLFSVNKYSPDKMPDKELLDSNIVKILKPNTKNVSIDISNLSIEFPPEGIFIGLEWIEGALKNNKDYTFDASSPVFRGTYQEGECLTWRKIYDSDWKKYHCFPSKTKKELSTPMFGLTIFK